MTRQHEQLHLWPPEQVGGLLLDLDDAALREPWVMDVPGGWVVGHWSLVPKVYLAAGFLVPGQRARPGGDPYKYDAEVIPFNDLAGASRAASFRQLQELAEAAR